MSEVQYITMPVCLSDPRCRYHSNLRLPLMYTHPYSQITMETEFDNPIYETGVRFSAGRSGYCSPLIQKGYDNASNCCFVTISFVFFAAHV